MNDQNLSFNKNGFSPVECIKQAFDTLHGSYWPLMGIAAVAMIVGSLVPMGILMGPMMCGVYICYLAKLDNRPFVFADLFNKGFENFVDSLIAMLIQMALILIPMIIVIVFAVVLGIILFAGQGNFDPNHNPAALIFILAVYLGIILLALISSIPFMFTFPLIADKKLKPWPAIKLSAQAVMGNLGSIFVLQLFIFGICILGTMCCYVGVLFVLPVAYMVQTIAYTKIFGNSESSVIQSL